MVYLGISSHESDTLGWVDSVARKIAQTGPLFKLVEEQQ